LGNRIESGKEKYMASRIKRWSEAVQSIEKGVEQLSGLCEEYREWKENMESAENSDNLMQSETYGKLEELEGLDIESKLEWITENVDEVKDADLPRGFGRD
tara:strand:+ start:614 stop:916 length:303 start_codon:yes stop_codon:yes gene_type:complete